MRWRGSGARPSSTGCRCWISCGSSTLRGRPSAPPAAPAHERRLGREGVWPPTNWGDSPVPPGCPIRPPGWDGADGGPRPTPSMPPFAPSRRATLPAMPRTPSARITVRDALDSAVIALTAVGCQTPRLDAELLLAAAIGADRAALIADPGLGLEPAAADRFADFARRRREREPVAYILGTKGFRHIDLTVDPRVLIPRPETEHVVEAALELPEGARVVDVGTGSGAIALALKHERPDLRVVAADASPAALEVARANAARLGLDVELHLADLLDGVPGPIDAVVSNPPYVAERERAMLAPEILRYEPAGALFAGPDGLDALRRLAPAAATTGATFAAFEVGAGQARAVGELLRAAGFAEVGLVPDLAGIERVVVGRRPPTVGA